MNTSKQKERHVYLLDLFNLYCERIIIELDDLCRRINMGAEKLLNLRGKEGTEY